eukprot:m.35194 g.35194  ORF g.35194 m.35194 type:complete len:400 (+) comp10899_c0_seq1:136-1335(+)
MKGAVTCVVLVTLLACSRVVSAQLTDNAVAHLFFRRSFGSAAGLAAEAGVTVPASIPAASLHVSFAQESGALLPAWLNVLDQGQQGLVVYGQPTKAGTLRLRAELRGPQQFSATIFWTLLIMGENTDGGVHLLQFSVRNLNATQLLTTRYNSLWQAVNNLNVHKVDVFLASIDDVTPATRNVPPDTFNPPIGFPNLWVSRVGQVTLGYFESVLVATCDDAELDSDAEFRAAGIDVAWTSCTEQILLPSASFSRSVPTLKQRPDWARSSGEFNRTLLPAIIIAVVLMVLGIVLVLCKCCDPSEAERRSQREALLLNKIKRNRTHAFRMLSTSPLEADRETELDDPVAPRASAVQQPRPSQDTAVRQRASLLNDALAHPDDAQLPRYRAPPDHADVDASQA